MYEKITKEDFDRIFDEAVLKQESKEKQYVVWTSAEMIDKIEQAIEDDIKKMLQPSELEQKIIDLRKEGHTYRGIQLNLGNPSKKFIKDTLKQYAPELAGDVVENRGKLKNQLYGS
jgi:hypothetical protein